MSIPTCYSHIFEQLRGLISNSKGTKWKAICPGHDDSKPSLSLWLGDNGCLLMRCQAGCDWHNVLGIMGLTDNDLYPPERRNKVKKERGKIVCTYPYYDEHGTYLYETVRFDPKDFRQRRTVDGRKVWNLDGCRRVLYRLPELLDARLEKPDRIVWVMEGERDCDNAAHYGLVAVCNPMGAGKWKGHGFSDSLAGANVVVIPDKDKVGMSGRRPGTDHAVDVCEDLLPVAKSVRWLELPGSGKDLSDWLNLYRQESVEDVRKRLWRLVSKAPHYFSGLHNLTPVQRDVLSPSSINLDSISMSGGTAKLTEEIRKLIDAFRATDNPSEAYRRIREITKIGASAMVRIVKEFSKK